MKSAWQNYCEIPRITLKKRICFFMCIFFVSSNLMPFFTKPVLAQESGGLYPGEIAYLFDKHNCSALEINYPFAYAALGLDGFACINISNPMYSFNTSSITLSGETSDLAIDGNLVYTVNGMDGINLLNVSDPESIHHIKAVFAGVANFQTIEIHGNTLFVLAPDVGIYTIDISDPANPYLMDSYNIPGAADVEIDGLLAYVASPSSALHCLNISRRQNITLLDVYSFSGDDVSEVTISGNLLYAAYDSEFLDVVSLRNPEALSRVEVCSLLGAATDVEYWGDFLFYSCHYEGICALDIGDHSVVDAYDLPQAISSDLYPEDFEIFGDYMFIADAKSGLRIVELARYKEPEYSGMYRRNDYSYNDLIIMGSLSTACTETGLESIDHFRYHQFSHLTNTSVLNPVNDIERFGHLVFAAGSTGNLKIYDNLEPGDFEELNTITFGSGTCYEVKAAGEAAFVAAGTDGIYAYNTSNPKTFVQLGSFLGTPLEEVLDIALDGNLAYIAYSDYGLNVLNITDVKNPGSIADNFPNNNIQHVENIGNLIYFANQTHFSIAEYRNRNLELRTTKAVSEPITQLTIQDHYLFVSTDSSLFIYDITNHTIPFLKVQIDLPEFARKIQVLKDQVYIATHSGILYYKIKMTGSDDDDNDGLTFFQEVWDKGTDPTNSDTDGDGVIDGEDFYPLDSSRSGKTGTFSNIWIYIVLAAIFVVVIIKAVRGKKKPKYLKNDEPKFLK